MSPGLPFIEDLAFYLFLIGLPLLLFYFLAKKKISQNSLCDMTHTVIHNSLLQERDGFSFSPKGLEIYEGCEWIPFLSLLTNPEESELGVALFNLKSELTKVGLFALIQVDYKDPEEQEDISSIYTILVPKIQTGEWSRELARLLNHNPTS